MGTMKWQPRWWNDNYASAWERVKEAARRDWEQTKHDLHVKGGHELNQEVGDTVRQAGGSQWIPPNDELNPPKVLGDWNDIELPTEYGYGARSYYAKEHTAWNRDLEDTLKDEWEREARGSGKTWDQVRDHVKRGYDLPH